jgi:hypothetical protein
VDVVRRLVSRVCAGSFFSFVFGLACSEAKVVEDSPAACSNQKDDDGDGLIDCNDPDCFATEACERNAATCANRIDDDGDGFIDCEQESCKALAVCTVPVETACNLFAKESLCPRGKGCYITEDNRHWCAVVGPSRAGEPCGATPPSDRSQGCAAGFLCGKDKRCALVCTRDFDCTRNSICHSIGSVSVCTLSCTTQTDCRDEEECVALQRTGLPLGQGGWAHECMDRRTAPRAGTATAGQSCFEDPENRRDDEICAPGLLCVPEPKGNKCRAVCRALTNGNASTCTGGLCYAVVPFSAQESRFNEPNAVGVCLP